MYKYEYKNGPWPSHNIYVLPQFEKKTKTKNKHLKQSNKQQRESCYFSFLASCTYFFFATSTLCFSD